MPSEYRKGRGLFRKYDVRRTDGMDGKGLKHDGCEYFVLDLTHDKHAKAALIAYADSCSADGYVNLARDLWMKAGALGIHEVDVWQEEADDA